MDLNSKKILFVDLDGTLIKTVSGKTFPEDPTDFRIRLEVLDKIKTMEGLNYICIVTNQAGIPEYISIHDFRAKFNSIVAFMFDYLNENPENYRIDVDGSFCFAKEKDHTHRKPNTGMLEDYLNGKLQFAIPELKSKPNILMIGDASGKEGDFSDSDRKCAENFGIDYLDVEEFIAL